MFLRDFAVDLVVEMILLLLLGRPIGRVQFSLSTAFWCSFIGSVFLCIIFGLTYVIFLPNQFVIALLVAFAIGGIFQTVLLMLAFRAKNEKLTLCRAIILSVIVILSGLLVASPLIELWERYDVCVILYSLLGVLFIVANISLITAPFEGAFGLLLSLLPVIRVIAQRSPRYFGLSLGIGYGLKTFFHAETKAFVQGWMRAVHFAGDRIRTGSARWETAYQPAAHGTDFHSEHKFMLSYMGNLYRLISSPAFEAEYIRSLTYRTAFAFKVEGESHTTS